MSAPHRVRAMTIGYQGRGNVGDEAILAGIAGILAGSQVTIETVVAGPLPVPAAPSATRLPMPRWLPSVALLRALRRSDLLIIAGGGLVNDYWSTLIPRYLLLTATGRLLGCRVAWIGVGAGPIRRRAWRWLAGGLVALSSLFAVRDARSFAVIRRISAAAHVRQVPDPAWFNEVPPSVVPTEGLGVVLRGPAPGEEARAGRLFDAIAEVIAARALTGSPVALVSMQADADGAAIVAVRERLEPRGLKVEVVRLPLETSLAIGRLARFEAVVTVRLHGLLLAALADRPCLPLVYDPKVAAAAEQLGLGTIALPVAEVSSEAIIAGLARVSENATRGKVREHLREILEQRAELAAAIEGIL